MLIFDLGTQRSSLMKLETYIPCEVLRPLVSSFAIQETAEERTYNVLPGTGLVIGFQYRGRLSRIGSADEKLLSVSGVSGLADTRRTFRNTPDTGTVLVFFREAGATPFFREPLHELFRQSVSLDNFMRRSELLVLEEQLVEATTSEQRVAAVEGFLIDRMTDTKRDDLVLAALALIHKTSGSLRVNELIRQLHISQSPLEKRFRQAVGTTPKKFASLVRMMDAIRRYDPAKPLSGLGYTAGFYDQSHFIKEFKAFTGDTPEVFFSGTQ